MAKRVDASALRLFVLKSSVDALLPFIATAQDLRLSPGDTPFTPLTADESQRPPGSYNVRAYCEWLADYNDEDEPWVHMALASLAQRVAFTAPVTKPTVPPARPAIVARPPAQPGDWKVDRRPAPAATPAPADVRFTLSRRPQVSSSVSSTQGE